MSRPGARYLVAGSRPWNKRLFDERISTLPGTWRFISDPAELDVSSLRLFAPRYLFFVHWSWKVPESITSTYECVGFHLGDLPRGRGGSPVQNLILRGERITMLTAFRMALDIDGGPVYAKRPVDLGGPAQEIYIRAGLLAAAMIADIIKNQPVPTPQQGEPTVFARRHPSESRVPRLADLLALHDFIRMLDAEQYPAAFLEYEGFRYEFSRSSVRDGHLVADVRITRAEQVP